MFTIESPGEEDELDEENEEEGSFRPQEMVDVEPCISVSALSGSHNFQTMRVTGFYKNKPLHILIDSGSTHNFLDLNLAHKLGLAIKGIASQADTVADGNHLACQNVCEGFNCALHNTEFISDVLLKPLGSCDMVLGTQWLSNLGTVSWDFKNLVMEFDYGSNHHVLKGEVPKKVFSVLGQKNEKMVLHSLQLYLLRLFPVDYEDSTILNLSTEVEEVPDCIEELLGQFTDVFAEPTCLPPARGVFDHRIPLEFGSNPVSIRPYRYPLK